MKERIIRRILAVLVCACIMCLYYPASVSHADKLDDMEGKSSDLKNQLQGINQELADISAQIAENEAQLEVMESEITKTQEQLAIAKNNEEAQYEDMKVRIQYIYENDGETILSMIFAAESLADFVNKVDFVQTISDYDRDMLEELKTLRANIENEESRLKEQKESYADAEKELKDKRKELDTKAAETSTDLADLNASIQKIKDEEARKAAEAAAAAAAAQNNSSGGGRPSSGGSSGGNYQYPTGDGVLSPSKGVVWFNGHKETYYSQKVLPGYGLQITGRHVAADGTIRDQDNYICVASSDHPKGTVVQTSLGPGKVYDSGCASGTIDVYTDW